MSQRIVMLAAVVAVCVTAAHAKEPATAPLYEDDPAVVKMLAHLGEGASLVLPPVKHVRDGKPVSGRGRSGPYARDYTNMMVWAPDRQTALYAGGNHGGGRTNDVWEFHLGSNTWHNLFPAEGRDHARFKWTLMFAPRIFARNPDYTLTEKQQKEWNACKEWWKENVSLQNGWYLTKGGGPLLVGHTWDTLVYEPNTKRMIHGTGAYCAAAAWIEHKFSGRPLEAVRAESGKTPDGTPYRTMWFFDPAARKWIPYASKSNLAVLRGMGASMTYIPDWKKVVYYVAAQNVTPTAAYMRTWDPIKDQWAEIKPNGGKSIYELAFTLKVAPTSEQQMAYSPTHRTLVAVLKSSTYAFSIDNKEWSKLNEAIPFMAHDAQTIFAYDSADDVFLLADPRNNRLAAFDLKTNKWDTITPEGPGMPKPPYCVGKGYYDPLHNVLVVQSAYKGSMWVYRHKKVSPAAK